MLVEKAFDKDFFLLRFFMENVNVYMILAFQELGFIANVKKILMFQKKRKKKERKRSQI